MEEKSYAHNPRHCCIALLFITILIIFVFNEQFDRLNQLLNGNKFSASIEFSMEAMDEANPEPLNKTTQEKNPSPGNTFSKEYPGDGQWNLQVSLQDLFIHFSRNTQVYVSFRGELYTSPPEV